MSEVFFTSSEDWGEKAESKRGPPSINMILIVLVSRSG